MTELSFFTAAGDDLVPTPVARGRWGADMVHGVALSGALARELERAVAACGRSDLRPARYTVDLFRPAAMVPSRTRSTIVRDGRRIALVDAELVQDGEVVARASAVFLKPSENPQGRAWLPQSSPEPPPVDIAPITEEPRPPLFHSDEAGWDPAFKAHQNAARKRSWNVTVPVVAGERPSPFCAAASIADATSMVTNWGSNGVEYINTDITLTLGRLPVGLEIGLEALHRVEEDGISVGTTVLFDRAGAFGTAMTTALANARRSIDFSGDHQGDDWDDSPSPGA